MVGIKDTNHLDLFKGCVVRQGAKQGRSGRIQVSLFKILLGGLPKGNHVVAIYNENFFFHLDFLPKYFVHQHGCCYAGVERLDMALHRNGNHLIHLLFDITGDPLPSLPIISASLPAVFHLWLGFRSYPCQIPRNQPP